MGQLAHGPGNRVHRARKTLRIRSKTVTKEVVNPVAQRRLLRDAKRFPF
jgi:hypothetical protein